MIDLANGYKGYRSVPVDDPAVIAMYEDKTNNMIGASENEYVLITNPDDGRIVDKVKWQDGRFKPLYRKPLESMTTSKIKAKNVEQELAIDMLMDEQTTVKTITGTWGSGKTLLSCAYAFASLQSGRYDKIVWIRNNVEVKDSNPIGFLKGDFGNKMMVWAMPLADHMGGVDALEMYIQRGQVEIMHLGFLRGRDIHNSLILCSEAEHLTREHVQLLLARVAEGSTLILEGDCRQIDAKAFERDNGLEAAIQRLRGNRLFGYVHLNESVRSDTAKLADLLGD